LEFRRKSGQYPYITFFLICCGMAAGNSRVT
jgi:hypothetical protein